jgi:uncharacterized protein (TIGR01244 family)
MSPDSAKRAARSRTSSWLGGGLAVLAFAALVVLERRRALRRPAEPQWRRELRNLAVAGASALAIRIAEKPVVEPLARMVEQRGWGLLQQARLPRWLELPLAVMLMDYTLYLWHILTHRAPFLWRFHVVHHADLDLSATTALRFHFAEMLLSVPWRAAQVVLLGVEPRALALWQKATLAEIVFHHSNLRLPISAERFLVRLIVTPRMHGIHHSTVREETDANWSSGLTLWDRLHGTLRLNVPQPAVEIGVPAWRDPQEVTLPKLMLMPFRREQRPSWSLPSTDRRPVRAAAPAWPRIFPDDAEAPIIQVRMAPAMQQEESMGERMAVNNELAVGTGQPTRDDLRMLAAEGFRSVVDLRREGERNQPLTPGQQERQAAASAGMAYVHLPVPTDRLSDDLLARFHEEVSRLPKPVLVHCASGKRSGTLAFMHDAIARGLSGREMMERAEEAGVLYGPQELRDEVRASVDRKTGSPA